MKIVLFLRQFDRKTHILQFWRAGLQIAMVHMYIQNPLQTHFRILLLKLRQIDVKTVKIGF